MSLDRIPWPLVAMVAIAGCRAPAQPPPVVVPEPVPHEDSAPAMVARLSALAALREIARWEDQRTIGPGGELLRFAEDGDPAVRERAATALGRLRFPNGGEQVTAKLRGLLADPHAEVRSSAAFALGMREDPSACEALLEVAQRDDAPFVRARAIEAASKLDPAARLPAYWEALDDAAPEVRLEAACGTARWKIEAPNAGEVDTRLAAFAAAEDDPQVRTYALFALERRKAVHGREAFLAGARAADAEERLFAVRGLAKLSREQAIEEVLIAASRDPDWRVAVEALEGLKQSPWLPALEAMASAIGSKNHHVRAKALEAATRQIEAFETAGLSSKTQGVGNFNHVFSDPSPAVRAAAVGNLLRHSSLPASEPVSRDPSPHVRAAFVLGLAKRDPQAFWELASPAPWDKQGEKRLLLQDWAPAWAQDENLLVRGALVKALAEVRSPEADARLVECLADADNGVRLAAVETLALRDQPVIEPQALLDCFASCQGEIASEVRFNLLRLAAKVGGAGMEPVFRQALSDPDPFVRQTARQEWSRLAPGQELKADEPPPAPPAELAFPGEGELANRRPRVDLLTSRGTLEFVLFADEAPQHVRNFLAQADFYAGKSFHRVVSDFVVQGGDARGDGNGGSSWRGDSLRHEIGPRKFVRGSLGMPRNEDWESGGSQIFVTHRPTPHLDGRFTIFGELVGGFDVLDRIDLDDTIVEVRVLP